jgi:hypothetical protein
VAGLEIFKKRLSLAQKDGMYVDAKLVDQTKVDQSCREAGTAKDQQVFARFLFPFGDFHMDIFGNQFCVFPRNILQVFRDDALGNVFDPVCKGDFVGVGGGLVAAAGQ